MEHPAPQAIRRADYLPPEWLIDTVDLVFDLRDEGTTVTATLAIRANLPLVAPAAHAGGEPGDNPDGNPDGASGPAERVLRLNGHHLDLLSAALDNQALGAEALEVGAESVIVRGLPDRPFRLTLVTRMKPEDNKALVGLYRSSGTYCTQCEAEGFRRITAFLDRPDVMARYTTTIEADAASCPVLLSNGNLVGQGPAAGGRHWARWEDPFPKPAYLFALVAGDLREVRDTFVTRSGRTVTLSLFVEPGNEGRCGHAMQSLKRAMAWDEQVFGLEYDLDVYNIVAVGDFNMGAMENKSLNVFNAKYVLASPDTATDHDFLAVESVIAHEYFHNWTGNRITCRDWFQLSLKEGLTVFRDQEFSADMNSRAVKRIADVQRLRAGQFVEDSGPLAHPVRPDSYIEINNFYTATVYEKGAEVIRMLRTLLGPDGFRRGMDRYIARHDGQAVTCDDFVAAMIDGAYGAYGAYGACGRTDATGGAEPDFNLEQFKLWYTQAGTPELDVDGQYDGGARTYRVTVRQAVPPTPGQPTKQPMVIPLALGLLGADGRDLPLRLADEASPPGPAASPLPGQPPCPAPTSPAPTGPTPTSPTPINLVLRIDRAEQSFTFVDVPEPPVPSLLRGFSAPVRLRTRLGDADLAFLMANDSDGFNRWEAGQALATRSLLAGVEAVRTGVGLSAYYATQPGATQPGATQPGAALPGAALPGAFVAAVGRCIARAGEEPAFAAHALVLPSEGYLSQQMAIIAIDAIHEVRQAARRQLAAAWRAEWRALYETCAREGGADLSPLAIGRRALKNLCLAYLVAHEDAEAVALAVAQYRTATTMTDAIGALSALANIDTPERPVVLEDFYTRWRHEPLIIDKWLSIQATSVRADTLATVRGLLGHPGFDPLNPNRIYSLIGAFCGANQVRFHEATGAGYDFLTEQVLRLNPVNPQVAARLAGPFARWRRVDPHRQALIRAQLERILAAPGLSPDVYEIVSKTLAA